jgi:hypothetical protein
MTDKHEAQLKSDMELAYDSICSEWEHIEADLKNTYIGARILNAPYVLNAPGAKITIEPKGDRLAVHSDSGMHNRE